MIHLQLTRSSCPAKVQLSGNTGQKGMQEMLGSGGRAIRAGLMLVLGSMMLGGCVTVSAPERPIVIELNINIKQDVVYRLADDAANTIQDNKGIF